MWVRLKFPARIIGQELLQPGIHQWPGEKDEDGNLLTPPPSTAEVLSPAQAARALEAQARAEAPQSPKTMAEIAREEAGFGNTETGDEETGDEETGNTETGDDEDDD